MQTFVDHQADPDIATTDVPTLDEFDAFQVTEKAVTASKKRKLH